MQVDKLELNKMEFPEKFNNEEISDDYSYKALALIASVANADGYLMLGEFLSYHKIAKKILGSSVLESTGGRVNALKFFLNPGDTNDRINELIDSGRMYSLGEMNFIQGMLDLGNCKNSVGLKPNAELRKDAKAPSIPKS